ncbi:hypothetical protein CRG98_043840 [Punica granatum]|uniref:Uncharacterized protein n=1 Tax=Punica granatum TaxID=22663 RepID=A0A2I0HVT2_PUNGR|nr:hypothetical protein CRG98_043840 [Punica granatum]
MLIRPSRVPVCYINSWRKSPIGEDIVEKPNWKRVRQLGKLGAISFTWSIFKWIFSQQASCGLPVFGLKAYDLTFFFDFSAIYIGAGMLTPHIINVYVLLGGILSWELTWPLIEAKRGGLVLLGFSLKQLARAASVQEFIVCVCGGDDMKLLADSGDYPITMPPSLLTSPAELIVFIPIRMILGYGMCNFLKVLIRSLIGLCTGNSKKRTSLLLFPLPPRQLPSTLLLISSRTLGLGAPPSTTRGGPNSL